MTDTLARLTAALADRYTIERELGQGGMATVYLAYDIKHERQVAIKVLREDISASLGAGRFLREIKIAAQLQHPHILPLLDSGEEDGFLFFVMPYIKGRSLRDRLDREGELPVHEAVRLITEVVDALVEAHEHGVVHRDIKPDNVMLSGRHALVTDFGVAKAISEATGRNMVTTLGIAVGTPTYMSPEQAAADPNVDHRSDIYSVGVMAFEMLSGRPPFVGNTPQQVLAAHVTEEPDSVARRRPAVPATLEAVVMRCLAKRPADRFQSAAELHAALEPLATPSGGMTPTHTRPVTAYARVRRWPRSLLTAVGLMVSAAAVWWVLNRPPATAELLSNSQLTRLPGPEEFPTISADGKAIAYRAFTPSDSMAHIEFRRTDGGDAIQIAEGTVPIGWSPSGDRLLLRGPRGLESRPALGGQGTVINPIAMFGCWAPDGEHLAYFVGDSLFVTGLSGEQPRLVTTAREPHSPVWSPDGKWIAFVSGNANYTANYNIAPSSIWLVAADGGTARALTPADGSSMSMSPTWAPDSRRLLLVSAPAGVRDVYQLNLTASGAVRGTPLRITTGLNPSLIALSANGSQLAYSVATLRANIWKTSLSSAGPISTRGALPVTDEGQTIEGFDISRDGKWLVFDSNREGLQQIFRMPLEGGPVLQLTQDPNPAFVPMISPNGSEVAYHAIANGVRRIFSVSINGGKSTQLSPDAAPDARNPSWAPDGRRIAWQVRLGTTGDEKQVATRDAQGRWGAPITVPQHGGVVSLGWADQGTALLGRDSSGYEGVQPIDGMAFRRWGGPAPSARLRTASPTPALSTDGKTLYFAGRRSVTGLKDGPLMVTGIRLADGVWREVLRFDEPSRPHSSVSNGIAEYGGWMYFTLSDFQSDIWVANVKGLRK